MPEPPAWRYQKITKPMVDIPLGHHVFLGRVLTGIGDEVIDDGFIEIKEDKIEAVGIASELGSRA